MATISLIQSKSDYYQTNAKIFKWLLADLEFGYI